VVFSADGKRLVSAGKDRMVRMWDPATGRLVRELPDFGGEVETVSVSPDSSLLATGDWAGDLRLWDIASGQELAAPRHPLGPRIWSSAFSPDGRYFAACGEGGLVLWKLNGALLAGRTDRRPTWQQLARIPGRVITALSFSPDGRLLAWVPGDSARLHFWDVAGSCPYPFPPLRLKSVLRNVGFYGDSKHVAITRQGGMPEVWDVTTRERLYPAGPDEFRGAADRGLDKVALSADDEWLAVQGSRGSVSLWDLQTRELLVALPEELATVWDLAWSPDRQRLALGLSDGRLVLWNIPRLRARLAEIGLDWRDPPAPATRTGTAKAVGGPAPVAETRLFALDVYGTARATLTTEGDVCQVDVKSVGDRIWHVALTRLVDDVQEGATYRVRFRARADVPRRMVLYGQLDVPDWRNIGLDRAAPLTADWQTYQYEFQARNFAAWNKVQLNLGDQTGSVWLADFSIEKLAK
jgi:hypothetical protein